MVDVLPRSHVELHNLYGPTERRRRRRALHGQSGPGRGDRPSDREPRMYVSTRVRAGGRWRGLSSAAGRLRVAMNRPELTAERCGYTFA